MKARLKVIDGSKPAPRKLHLWECPKCNSTTAVKVRRMAMIDSNGKMTGGSDHWVCASCLARGIVTSVQ
jgi:hypothetical protein